MPKKTVTLCVDAQYLLKQSINAWDDLYAKDEHIGGLYGFFTIIRRLLPIINPDRVILFFDGTHSGKLRYEIYDQYKSNRIGKEWYANPFELTDKEIEKELKKSQSSLKQRILIKQFAEELFFRQVECPDGITEADDMIGYYTQNLKEHEEAVIYTNDRDLLQLIRPNNKVTIYLANKKTIINEHNYFMYFNHHLSNMPLIKAIEGDQSDFIPGIGGVKQKTLLKFFPEIKKKTVTFDEIYDKTKILQEERIENKKKPLKSLDNILNNRDIYDRNMKLVDLSKPLITEECIKELKEISTLPLDSENRGSKNLIRLMVDIGFIECIWNNDYVDYLVPFFGVINSEKEYFKNYG